MPFPVSAVTVREALTVVCAWHAAVEAAALGAAAGQHSPQGLQGAQGPHCGVPYARGRPAGGPVQQCELRWLRTAKRALHSSQCCLLTEAQMPKRCIEHGCPAAQPKTLPAVCRRLVFENVLAGQMSHGPTVRMLCRTRRGRRRQA